MGFFGRLFGTEKALEKIVDAGSNALDKLVYTDEEKAEDAAKERSEARSMVVEWMRSTRGQNLARRLLALVITSVWLLMYVTATALSVCAIWINDSKLIEKIYASSDIIGDKATQMNGAMMLILGFYFAAPHLSEIIPFAMKRFGGLNKNDTK